MDERTLKVVERIGSEDKLAYNQKNAAKAIDLSYPSLRREIKRGKIHTTDTFKLITKAELLRYLGEEEQLARRKKHQGLRRRSIAGNELPDRRDHVRVRSKVRVGNAFLSAHELANTTRMKLLPEPYWMRMREVTLDTNPKVVYMKAELDPHKKVLLGLTRRGVR